jgi:hypothetical protein
MFANLILACSLLSLTRSADCRIIEDRDRRSFDERSPIFIDVHGDGKPDRIWPRLYAVRAKRKPLDNARQKAKETHWITFDLKTSKGKVAHSFFRYEYGTEEADYWVYALVPCDINKDGRPDLVFYSRDDTSDETIILLNKGGRFIVHSRKVSEGEK